MAGREGPYKSDFNSTDYIHPKDENLNNLHKSMDYNADGQPVIRTTVAGVTINGNVNVDKVKVWDGTNTIMLDQPNNDGEPGQWSVPTESYNMVYNGTSWDRMRGTINDGVLTKISNTRIAISKDGNLNEDSNPIFVSANVSGGTLTSITNTVNVNVLNSPSVTVTSGNITVGSITNTANVNILNSPSVTVTSGNITVGGSVSVSSLPEVEIKNDTGNPISVSRNTTTNSADNPIYVTGSGGSMGDFPDVAVTAFEEPLAVGITPVQQADSVYGLDPDFWRKTELRGGSITTENSTWKVQSGTSAGGYARLATARYATYQPGQGVMFRWTAAFTANGTTRDAYGVDNIVQNTGPIDREDGYSIGYSGATDDDEHRKIGILHRQAGKAEIRELTVTTYPTGAQTATIVIDSVSFLVNLTASTSTTFTANQIALALKANTTSSNMWDIDACDSKITLTYYSPGARNGTYSFSSAGTGTLAVASWNRLVIGSSPTDTWTYVKDWNGTVPVFNPTKLNVYGIDMRWLGAGRVRFFMEDPATAKMVLIHTQKYSNTSLVPHVYKPSLRIVYRSGTTNPAITPSQNVIVTGASIFAGVQGIINQTGGSQGYYTINSSGLSKDLVHHLLSIQNPTVRAGAVNKSSIILQDLTVSQQGQDPSIIFIIKNCVGTTTPLLFNPIPGSSAFVFAQYSDTTAQENITLDTLANIQTLGINSSSQFDLKSYNLVLAPGEYLSVFISSSNAINRTSCGMTWRVG